MEDKKLSQYLILLSLGNVISLTLSICTIGYIINSGPATGNNNGIPKEIAAGDPKKIELQDSVPQGNMKSGIYNIEISDNGFSPEGISAQIGKKINLEITNRGQSPHSFVIDGLNANSGPIKPGETVSLTIEPPLDKETGYVYKSLTDAGKIEFTGALIIIATSEK